MCIRIKLVRSKVRLSGNARIASVHGPPYLFQRLVWPITVWVFLVSDTGSHVKGDFPIIIHFDFSMPYLNLHLSLYIVHISIRHCKPLAFVENIVMSSAYAIEL